MILVKSFIVIVVIFMLYYIFRKIKQQRNRTLEGLENMNGSSNDSVGQVQQISFPVGGPGQVQQMGYTPTGLERDPTYLAITNAANIAFLKSQIDGLGDIKQKIKELEAKVEQNASGISQVSQSLINTGQQITGGSSENGENKTTIPTISGLE
jgi:hypothetical protein